jgi:Fe-S-cluster containining protein
VFAVEANPIRQWFMGLDSIGKKALLERWNEPRQPGACAFLRNDSCTIYEARPLICRTQGLAMRFQEEKEGLRQTLIDICPLNDSMLEIIHENEVLNLDLLNRILATLEQQEAQGTPRERPRLLDLQSELKNLTDEE